ncbi:hypothetical protein ACGFXC_10435 [Streptomyces sp. NPDC048507]|uniref:hypothetical protein n=1 Tax=Streptomyces sp. NPDC048507 TaxID=3365560 RepID=UPI00371415A5
MYPPQPLPPLARPFDLADRLGRSLTPEEMARSSAVLADASALVRSYTRQEFTFQPQAVTIQRPVGNLLRLPQTPVHAVWAVHMRTGWPSPIISDGQPAPAMPCMLMPPHTWSFDGVDTVALWIHGGWLNAPESWTDPDWDRETSTYTVTYAYGYETVPPDVMATVCGMALRVLLAPSMAAGMLSERIGNYSYQQAAGGGAAVTLTQADRDALAVYRRKATTIQARQ